MGLSEPRIAAQSARLLAYRHVTTLCKKQVNNVTGRREEGWSSAFKELVIVRERNEVFLWETIPLVLSRSDEGGPYRSTVVS